MDYLKEYVKVEIDENIWNLISSQDPNNIFLAMMLIGSTNLNKDIYTPKILQNFCNMCIKERDVHTCTRIKELFCKNTRYCSIESDSLNAVFDSLLCEEKQNNSDNTFGKISWILSCISELVFDHNIYLAPENGDMEKQYKWIHDFLLRHLYLTRCLLVPTCLDIIVICEHYFDLKSLSYKRKDNFDHYFNSMQELIPSNYKHFLGNDLSEELFSKEFLTSFGDSYYSLEWMLKKAELGSK